MLKRLFFASIGACMLSLFACAKHPEPKIENDEASRATKQPCEQTAKQPGEQTAKQPGEQPTKQPGEQPAKQPGEQTAIEFVVPTKASTIDPQWNDLVVGAASLYKSWQRVDDEMRFAPTLCRMPSRGKMRLSQSTDQSTHGSKLYFVYALAPQKYGFPPTGMGAGLVQDKATVALLSDKVEQVLVKESFRAKALAPDSPHDPMKPTPALKDGVRYGMGEATGLYLMLKIKAGAAVDTDEGWIYATVLPSGEISASGKIASCMSCHVTEDDRMFGLPGTKSGAPLP